MIDSKNLQKELNILDRIVNHNITKLLLTLSLYFKNFFVFKYFVTALHSKVFFTHFLNSAKNKFYLLHVGLFFPWILNVSKIDCLRFVMCPLLARVCQGFFFAVAINSTNEANKASSMHC